MNTNYTDECLQQFDKLIESKILTRSVGHILHKLENDYPIVYKKAKDLIQQFNLSNMGEALYWIKNRLTEYPHCQYHTHPKCDDHPRFYTYNVGYRKGCKYCGRKNPDIFQKQKDGCIKKYGVENAMLNKEVKEKQNKQLERIHKEYGFGSQYFKDVMIERYGVDNPSKNLELKRKSIENKAKILLDPIKKIEIIQKKQNTEIEKYGTLYTRLPECQIKRSETFNNSQKYQDYCKEKIDELKSRNIFLLEPIKWEQDNYSWKCLICGTEYTDEEHKITLSGIRNGKFYWCPKCYKHSGQSSNQEWEISYYIQSQIQDIKIEHNRRDLIPNNYKEIDLWFPDYNIGIEFCGMIYHATFPYGLNGKGLSKDYHQNKFYLCQEYNIKLITMFEFEWMTATNRKETKKRLLTYFNRSVSTIDCKYICNVDKDLCIQFLAQQRYWCQFIESSNIFKGVCDEDGIILGIFINIKDNDYIFYKMNYISLNGLYDICKHNNINIIQDNRYPISFDNIQHYYDSLLWEYHNGWCSDIYKQYPTNDVNIRKINDCGYSKILF